LKTLRIIAVLIVVIFLAFAPLLAVIPALANETVNGSAWENETLSLTAPEGYYFSGVESSYYGNPHTDQAIGCSATDPAPVFAAFVGKTSGSIVASNGVFGDPCPGVYKILTVALFIQPVATPTPTPTRPVRPRPTHTSTWTPKPTVEPSATPTESATPEPTVTPSPTPSATEEPTVEPTPTPTTPTQEPTSTLTPTKKPTSIPSQAFTPTPVTPEPSSSPEVTPVEPTPTPTVEAPTEEVLPILAVADALNNIGKDMSPEVRKRAQKEVIAAVIVTQVAQTAVAAAARRRK